MDFDTIAAPMQIDPFSFARKLIDIPSTTEHEFEVGEFLDGELTRLGFKTRRHAVTDRRFNLYAAAGGRPRVVLNSHIDTVPPWFASSEDEEFIYGRGACDTKGVIAAMVSAGVSLRARGVDEFAFLFVVAEETDSIGAKTANVEFAGLGSEFVLVGEPTESMFARASKGAFSCTIRFEGKAGHSAYPERGDSAINRMVAALAEITAADWGAHEVLGKSTVNVGVVRGGEKANVIAAEAEADIIFRIVGEPEEVSARVSQMVAQHNGRIVKSHGNPPQFMVVPEGERSSVVAFNTDVPHLKALGKPLLFGPGSILDAHSANEKISKRDLIDAAGRYEQMVIALLEGRIA